MSEQEGALKAANGRGPICPVEKSVRQDRMPLSISQSSWYPNTEKRARLHRVPLCLRFLGYLDIVALERAFICLVDRHEILRTRYFTDKAGHWQQVLGSASLRLELIDVSYLPYGARVERAQALLRDYLWADRIDFQSGTNLWARVVRLGPEDHVLHVLVLHIAADGSSIATLTKDLFEFYRAARTGTAPNLPRLALQYGDFALWQRAGSGMPGEELRQQLDPAEEAEPVGPATLSNTRRVARRAGIFIRPHEWSEVKQMAARSGATPAMAVLAATVSGLKTHLGLSNPLVGMITNARPPSAMNLVGCFLRLRPIEPAIDGAETFSEILAATKKEYIRAVHPDIDKEPARHTTSELCQVFFNYIPRTRQNVLYKNLSPEIAVQNFVLNSSFMGLENPLEIRFLENESFLAGAVTHDANVYDSILVEQFAQSVGELLISAAEGHSSPMPAKANQ